MPDHYFTEAPASAHDMRAFSLEHAGRTLRFETDAGVFSKGHLDQGTRLLVNALPADFTGRALDLGCGWGAVGVCMAAQWPQAEIVLVDINARAVALARQNIAANGLTATVVQGDGPASAEGVFDLIALNPPIRAGKPAVYRLFDQSVACLAAGGALYIVMRKQQGAPSAKAYLETLDLRVEVMARAGGFRVMRCTRRAEGA